VQQNLSIQNQPQGYQICVQIRPTTKTLALIKQSQTLYISPIINQNITRTSNYFQINHQRSNSMRIRLFEKYEF